MSDISKIKINNTTYDIKDATARTDAASAVSAVDNKVSKSGDTMTGTLRLDNGSVTIVHDASTASSTRSSSAFKGVYIRGNNNDALAGCVESQLAADGNNVLTIISRHPNSSGVNYDCGVRFIVHPDGSKYITLYDKDAWLSALNLSDSGWKTLNSSKPTYYRKIGDIVNVMIKDNNNFSGSPYTLGTLPAGYRPKTNMWYISSGVTSQLSIDGVLTTTGTGWFAGWYTYIAA